MRNIKVLIKDRPVTNGRIGPILLNGKEIGHFDIVIGKNHVYIEWFGIDNVRNQKRGLGRIAWNLLEAKIVKLYRPKRLVLTWADTPAKKFWTKMGFRNKKGKNTKDEMVKKLR